MKSGFVKSSTHLLPLIKRAMLIFIILICVASFFYNAPLQQAADPAITPNPAKSAWFLLWIQELVSWSNQMIWLVVIISLLLFFLPWLSFQVKAVHAEWFPPGTRVISAITVIIVLLILMLTITAICFRGANWSPGF